MTALQLYFVISYFALFHSHFHCVLGHVAAALDDNRMFVFGGRGVGGRILNDSWIYHYDKDRYCIVLYYSMQLCFHSCLVVL